MAQRKQLPCRSGWQSPAWARRCTATTSTTNAIPKDGEINPKGLDKVMQWLVEDGALVQPLPKTDKYVDMSYRAEARRTLP